MKSFKLADILLPYQRKFIENPSRRKIWISSRQIGKSFSIAFLMTMKVLQREGTLGLCVSTGSRAASELLKKCRKMAEAVKVMTKGKVDYTFNSESLTFSNGSRIMSLPSNPDAVRGYSSRIVCLDEAAFIPFAEEIYQAIAPTLTRDKESELIVCSTPAGCSGLFHDLLQSANGDWYVQRTTIEDAVNDGLQVDVDELRNLVKDPDIFNQEYMCVFSKEYGAFIDTDILDWYESIPDGESTYYLGMDIGRRHDRTALTILRQVNDRTYLENIITLTKCDYQTQIQVVKDLNDKYQFRAGYIDEGGIGSAVAEQISKTISSRLKGIQFTAGNKTRLYEAVRARIFDHTLLFNPEHKDELVQDFNNVKRLVNEQGQVKFDAGRDSAGHSDICSSLTLGVEALRENPPSMTKPQSHVNFSSFGQRKGIFCRY